MPVENYKMAEKRRVGGQLGQQKQTKKNKLTKKGSVGGEEKLYIKLAIIIRCPTYCT